MASTIRVFSFDHEGDKDILDWLDGLQNQTRSQEVRAAIRRFMGGAEPTNADIIRAIETLQVKLESGYTVYQNADRGEEPETAARNLDDLLGRLKAGEFD